MKGKESCEKSDDRELHVDELNRRVEEEKNVSNTEAFMRSFEGDDMSHSVTYAKDSLGPHFRASIGHPEFQRFDAERPFFVEILRSYTRAFRVQSGITCMRGPRSAAGQKQGICWRIFCWLH